MIILYKITIGKTKERRVIEKALLDLKEFCEYTGFGETKAREMLKIPRNGFALKIGSKWYVHKERLDAWLLEQCDKY